jgi:hypothetical protein
VTGATQNKLPLLDDDIIITHFQILSATAGVIGSLQETSDAVWGGTGFQPQVLAVAYSGNTASQFYSPQLLRIFNPAGNQLWACSSGTGNFVVHYQIASTFLS